MNMLRSVHVQSQHCFQVQWHGFKCTFKKDSNAFPVCAAHHVDVAHNSVHGTPGLDANPPPMQADVLSPAQHTCDW